MEFFSLSACVSLAVLFISVEQLICLPLVREVKNSTLLAAAMGQNSTLQIGKEKELKKTINMKRLLTYDDLPDDGSLDEEYKKQHGQELEDDTFILLDNGELYEGDIKLDPLTRLYMEVDRNLPPRRKRAIARDRTKRWEGGVIPYVIDRKLPARTKYVIRQAIRHWKMHTNKCLTFRRKMQSDRDFIQFYDDGEACWSQVGRIGNQQNISITARCASRGVVIHEIGHAVGFYHQHARRDRDKYISLLTRNILPIDRGQFERIPHRYINSMGYAYDYWSAMHYGPFAFSAKKGEPTIRIKKTGRRVKAKIGLRVLSKLDIAKVRAMYNCNPIPSFEARRGCFRSKHGDGREYRGKLDYTETGIACQYWSERYPHKHSKNLRKHGLGRHNYCRNPGGRRLRPWCFTTKTKVRWQYCDIKLCRR